jgi:hypothetical protein
VYYYSITFDWERTINVRITLLLLRMTSMHSFIHLFISSCITTTLDWERTINVRITLLYFYSFIEYYHPAVCQCLNISKF